MTTDIESARGAVGLAPLVPPRSLAARVADSSVTWRIVSFALFALAWEIAGRIPISFAFPTFSDTFEALVRMILDGSMGRAYLSTLQPLALGLFLSATIGVGLGIVFGLSRTGEWLGVPVFVMLQAAPVAAFIPLVTFVYGIGLTSKTLAVIILALPVIVLNAYKAIRNVNETLVTMTRSFLGNRTQEVFKVVLPDASPVIFAGLRLGIAAGFIGVILAELLITPTGIGDLITYHRSVADYAEMYAAITSIIVLSTLTLVALQWFEVRFLRPEKRGT
jgi:NitT/TauT family transport system permease protein